MRISLFGAAVSLCLVGLCSAQAQSAHASIRKDVSVPPEDLSPALQFIAKQYDFQILFHTELVQGVKTQGASGSLTSDEVLTKVLVGTGLSYKYLDPNTVTVFPVSTALSTQSPQDQSSKGVDKSSNSFRTAQLDQTGPASAVSNSDLTPKKDESLTEIVVTGSLIRGVTPDSSPLAVYSSEYIQSTGATTIEEFSRLVPQNLASNTATPALNGGGGTGLVDSAGNSYFGSSFNLRGLGSSATLTLVDGRRVSPAGASGDFFDVSLIPLEAVDRIEILSDGASALYGSDAVAGVVNIILKKNFSGAETSVRYGDTQHGGGSAKVASQSLGTSWSSGNAMLIFEHRDSLALSNSERGYLPDDSVFNIQPAQRVNELVSTVRQDLGAAVRMEATGIYSERSSDGSGNSAGLVQDFASHSRLFSASAGFDGDLPRGWLWSAQGAFSETNETQSSNNVQSGMPAEVLSGSSVNKIESLDLKLDGPLFSGPGGAIKGALLGSYRREDLDDFDVERDGVKGVPDQFLSRTVSSVAAEMFVPIVGTSNRIPGVERLELSLSGRYDHYSDVGSTANPRFGLLWGPLQSLKIRGTYARSFHAPSLDQEVVIPNYAVYPVPDPASAAGFTSTLFDQSTGTLALNPEKSTSETFGFDWNPESLKNLRVSATYFNVRYEQRIATVPIPGAFLFNIYQPGAGLDFLITRNPSLAYVESLYATGQVQDFGGPGFVPVGPAGVQAIFDDRVRNLASTSENGVDASVGYSWQTSAGNFVANLSGTYLLKDDYQALSTLPAIVVLNRVNQPINLRLLGSLAWSYQGFSVATTTSYVNGYRDDLVTPSVPVSSWTTTDLSASYRFPESGVARGLTLSAFVRNVADKRPPFLQEPAANFGVPQIGFDTVNANVVGRFFSIQLRKAW